MSPLTPEEPKRCLGTTTRGKRCKRNVYGDPQYCTAHEDQLGRAPGDDSSPAAEALDRLLPRQRMFVEAYLANGLNQTRAAITAGYTETNAAAQGSTLMRHPDVVEVIEARLQAHAMSANETLARLTEWGRGTIDHFVDDQGRILLDTEQAISNRHLIKKIHVDRHGNPESIELQDPQSAVKMLAKIHGLVTDRIEHSGSVETRSGPEYDYSVLTDEELDQLEKITAKLEATAQPRESTGD